MIMEVPQIDSTGLINPSRIIGNVSVKNVVPNMEKFPTPPSSSGDSPQPIYFVASPTSNNFSVASPETIQPYIQTHILPTDTNMATFPENDIKEQFPFLRFIEQPTNKFRFRYKSEMAGTHGSLCGMNSDKSRKQTYPTVELVNFPEKAEIRCSIYQYNVEEDFKPHPHRLIMKKGKDELEDPHDVQVGPEEGFVATFHSMGIIHTARKNIVSELFKKKTQLKRELIATLEGKVRDLTPKECLEIKGLAEQESKSINLNIVCLRFDAFLVKNGIRNPICSPIYSHGINNLKCALTGDLKIVRMDHCSSKAKGGQEIFLLVERVTKKNIRIRFFELDDEEQEIWEGWGKFTELDVHHQYAIVFKTPAFRDQNISSPVLVYMELVRPSDNARSEMREFRFIPNNDFKPGSKRPRSSLDSSSSYNSSSLNSNELPSTIANAVNQQLNGFQLPSANSWNQQLPLTEDQLNVAMKDVDSDEFKWAFELIEKDLPNDMSSCAQDSPLTQRFNDMHIARSTYGRRNYRPSSLSAPHVNPLNINNSIVKMEISADDWAKAQRSYNELRSFIKSTDARERAPLMLEHHLGEEPKRRNNALHVFIAQNKKEELVFLLKMLILSEKKQLTNVPNVDNLTPLHIAVICRNEEFVTYLLHCNANPTKQNGQGRTVLHEAVKSSATPRMFEFLLASEYCRTMIDMEDYDGTTALQLAIETNNMTAIKLLCKSGANVNRQNRKDGHTPLRMAVECQFLAAIQYFLEYPSFDPKAQNDFQNVSAYHAATVKPSSEAIMEVITKFMLINNIPLELKKEKEDEDEEEIEEMEEIDIKDVLPENLETLYVGLKKLTPKCLDEVAAVLDESGKYVHLAELLDLDHLLHSGIISNERSVSKNLLQYAIERDNVDILLIRNFLENLDEHIAVGYMDRMAEELHQIQS